MNSSKLFFICILILFAFTCSEERKQWKETKRNNTLKAYDEFLNLFPESRYAADAESLRQDLIKKKWFLVSKKNTIAAYLEFSKQCNSSEFNKLAQDKIQKLTSDYLDSSFYYLDFDSYATDNKAKILLETILTADSTNALALNNLAIILVERGDYQTALYLLNRALNIESSILIKNITHLQVIGNERANVIVYSFFSGKIDLDRIHCFGDFGIASFNIGSGFVTKLSYIEKIFKKPYHIPHYSGNVQLIYIHGIDPKDEDLNKEFPSSVFKAGIEYNLAAINLLKKYQVTGDPKVSSFKY